MAKVGGKRAGSGRKPRALGDPPPAKASNFSTRIKPELRSALEHQAALEGKSVSEMAAALMQRGLADSKATTDPTIRALCYLVTLLADTVEHIPLSKQESKIPWRVDPFMFESLRLSIDKVLNIVRPRGKIVSPVERHSPLKGTDIWGPLESTEDRANWASIMIVRALLTAKPEPLEIPVGMTEKQAKLAQAASYGLAQARRDLGYENFELSDLTPEAGQ